MNYRRFKYSAVFLLLVFLYQGCGIFETRDPEEPVTIRSTFFPPTSAEVVTDNLSYAIQEKNSSNYFKCLSLLNFQYIPDSRSQQQYELIFTNWGVNSEKNYFDNLIARQEGGNSSSVLFVDNERLTQYSSDSARYQADYIFVFQHNQSNIPKSSKGRMSLILATDSDDLYYIRRWEDFRQNDTDFTWSEFKANFSN
ncbi:MAG TPA: hypothetical protein PK605_00510 [Ignavibacteria bacterium]|nr:hypothetical protein [Bacteroidota bacterium]HRE10735.1 hypothetical protein [Ignavibacteria bacterium]HRF66021.1 hypothetical protein [Ignavibacteria bacterium]HRJ02861.1 hypothetical protein [Ignavibacteria bacterium]HRJ84419.1 hypothetical protein [Ignavibacteria bacterium]